MEKTVRINKALADAGVCSRRRADELIAAGRVSVNGEPVASPGLQVTPGTDKLEVDGKPVQPIAQAPCYLLLNKPVRVVSTAYDPEGRTTVLDLVPAKWKARRLYPAGRLDFFSEGLVLLTDDGDLTNRVVHPRHHMPRVYHVLIRGGVSDRALEVMRKGMTLAEGEKLAPVEIRVLPGQVHDLSGVSRNAGPPAGQRGTLLEMTLHQGLKGTEARARTLEYLRDVGISDPEVRFKQYPHEFSGGMRQRVVIAIAVACSPKILICDEPTTALDVTIQAQILQLLKELRAKYHLTIVMITHDLGVVANIADRVAVMYAGDIVEIGTADEIYYDPRHPYTWALLSSMPQMGIKGEDLFNIVGTPPNLFAEIRGDAFAPRNPQALKIDYVKRPPYFEVSPTHKAKTWLLDPRAPHIEPPAAVKKLQKEGL